MSYLLGRRRVTRLCRRAHLWQSMTMLTVIGEGLVDVVQRASGIEAHVGGSPLNVAVGLARLDHPVQFVGRYGRDAYGDSVAAHLRSSSVMLPLGPDELPTSVATAVIDDDGAATYTFDLAWELPGLSDRLAFMLQGTTLLHTGSIATMLAPGAAAVLAAVEHAHPAATISFDPNCRPSIITDVDYARRQAEKFVTLSDVVKASDEDLEWLYPGVDVLESARRWLSLGGSEGLPWWWSPVARPVRGALRPPVKPPLMRLAWKWPTPWAPVIPSWPRCFRGLWIGA
ncbi:fructokinase [Arthrobacter sp. Hiyo4]|nr:fructokinase [Arthrobacter sp. Hiyo4]